MRRKLKRAWGKLTELYSKITVTQLMDWFVYLSVMLWLAIRIFDISVSLDVVLHTVIMMQFAIYVINRQKPNIHVHVHDSKKPKQ